MLHPFFYIFFSSILYDGEEILNDADLDVCSQEPVRTAAGVKVWKVGEVNPGR